MIEELAMVSVLAGMGVYFVKSTDLPKELKERSKQLEVELAQTAIQNPTKKALKFQLPNASNEFKAEKKALQNEESLNVDILKKTRINELLDKEINELTLKITALEQEIKANNLRNSEIQEEIDLYLERLELVNKKRLS